MKCAFVFGKNWRLSLAEILAYFEKESIEWEFIDLSKKALVAEAEVKPDIISKLGGTLKIIRVEKEFDFSGFKSQEFGDDINLPISVYGSYKLLHDIRKVFKVIPKDGVLTVRQMIREKMPYENCLVFGMKTCYYGPTIITYEPYEQKKRDENRPHTDYLTIAPSRAMILVNLSRAKKNLLDPFCGMGTIAQEAILLGIKNIYISDIDKKAVSKAKNNLKWAQKKHGRVSVHAKVMDARNLDYEGITAIATEPYLGPSLKSKPTVRDAKKIAGMLNGLYSSFFSSAYRVLKPGSKIAIALPVFNAKGKKVYVEKFFPGFRLANPFDGIPEEYKALFKLNVPFIEDEEREKGKMRNVIREFCIYEVKK